MLPAERSNPVGAALLVKMGEMSWGSLSDVAGVPSLEGVGTFMPGSGFELNSEAFDYSGWTPLVPVTLISRPGNFMRLADEGALLVCTADDTVAPGVYGFRFDAPYC